MRRPLASALWFVLGLGIMTAVGSSDDDPATGGTTSRPAAADDVRGPGSAEGHALLRDYHGEVAMPDGLLKAYARFVRTVAVGGDAGDLTALCLPSSVRITTEPRPAQTREYGRDISLPYLRESFDAQVRVLREEAAGCYLVRTGTSALWYVETKSLGWKLYSYLDKPIR